MYKDRTYKHELDHPIVLLLIIIVFGMICFSFAIIPAFAEPIMITITGDTIEHTVFDGKWTTWQEWKPTSLDMIGHEIYIRSAHHKEFVYVMIDVINDQTPNRMADKAIICFDTKNEKSHVPDQNDYCFVALLNSLNGKTLQGGSISAPSGFFKNIQNHNDFVAVGGVSDENDRYSKIPHAGYEFRIPTEVIGRSDNYGFLVYVLDSNENKVSTWPEGIQIDDQKRIPSPDKWGNMISPDKKLPEFGTIMILILLIGVSTVLVVSRKNSTLYSKF